MPEILDYAFMRSALLAGVMLGALFSLIGVFVVTRGMSFYSDFVAHAAILGGALAVMLKVDTTLFLIPFSVVLALGVSGVWHRMPLSRDTVLGVFYGGAVSLGVILISVKGMGTGTVMQFLFGDILLIGPGDIWLAGGLLAVFAVFLGVNLKRLVRASFLPEVSEAEGIRVKYYDYALMGLIAVTIAVSIKLVGVLLANAMVVIPAASAKCVSRSFRGFMIMAPVLGISSFLAGTVLSFYLNIPSGPSIAACSFGMFVICGLGSMAKR